MPKISNKPDPNLELFLKKIAMIESSGGKNTEHPVIEKEGIQQGQQAIGTYGLLPNTVKELINRRRMEGTLTPDMRELKDEDNDEFIRLYVDADPKLQKELAETLGKRVLSRQLGDEDRAAYGWNSGHNLSHDQVTDEMINHDPYVQKFRALKNIFKSRIPASIKKLKNEKF